MPYKYSFISFFQRLSILIATVAAGGYLIQTQTNLNRRSDSSTSGTIDNSIILRISNLESSKASRSDLNTLSRIVSQESSNLDSQRSRLDSVENDLKSIPTDLVTYESRLKYVESGLNSAQTNLNSNLLRLESVETTINSFSDNLDTFGSRMESVENGLTNVQTDLELAESGLNSVQNQLNINQQRLRDMIETVRDLEASSVSKDTFETMSNFVSMEAIDMDTLDRKMTIAEQNIQELQNSLGSVASELQTVDSEIDVCQTDILSVQADLAAMRTDLDSVQTGFTDFVQTIQTQLSQFGQSINTVLTSFVGQVQSSFDKSFESLNSYIETVASGLSNLQTESNQHSQRLDTVETDFETVKMDSQNVQLDMESLIEVVQLEQQSMFEIIDEVTLDLDTCKSEQEQLISMFEDLQLIVDELVIKVDSLEK